VAVKTFLKSQKIYLQYILFFWSFYSSKYSGFCFNQIWSSTTVFNIDNNE